MLEWIGLLSGIAYLLLITFYRKEGWWFGILSCACYAWLSFEGKIYLQAGLQLLYVILGFYALYQWGKPENKIQIKPIQYHLIIGGIGLIFWSILFYSFQSLKQENALLDAFICAFSLLATYLSTKSIIQHWFYWIVLNLLTFWLFQLQDLEVGSYLYLFNTGMSIFAFYQWKKQLNE